MAVNYKGDIDYAIGKLPGSIVKVDGEPVIVDHLSTDGVCVINLSSRKDSIRSMKDLDLSPFRLGFVNGISMAAYITRMPARQWRQGIRNSNLQMIYPHHSGVNSSFVNSQAFYRMLKGIYPSIKDCVESLANEEIVSTSFHRNFGLLADTKDRAKILFKGEAVGYLNYEFPEKPVLDKKHTYLQETLEAAQYV